MARPRLDQRPVRQKLTLCLRPGEDDDLIAYLDQARELGTPLAQAVVAAMRGGLDTAVSPPPPMTTNSPMACSTWFFDANNGRVVFCCK